MRATFLLLFISFFQFAPAQSVKLDKAIKKINDYKFNSSGYVTFERIVDFDTIQKDHLFSRAEEFFVYHYGSGKAVLQVNDRGTGRLIGKGLFLDMAKSVGLILVSINTWHIFSIEIKDGKARMSVSLVEYIEDVSSWDGKGFDDEVPVASVYPFRDAGAYKGAYGKAFLASRLAAFGIMDQAEKMMRELKDDW